MSKNAYGVAIAPFSPIRVPVGKYDQSASEGSNCFLFLLTFGANMGRYVNCDNVN